MPVAGHYPADAGYGRQPLHPGAIVAERVRRWLDMLRARGIAAVHEAITADGLAARVLARPDGERLLTDLDHLGQVLHDVQHREGLGLPGLLEWLRSERENVASERVRRLDSDAAAVQITTVHQSKGLQYPVVHLPFEEALRQVRAGVIVNAAAVIGLLLVADRLDMNGTAGS